MTMENITAVRAREVLDSRGKSTLAATVEIGEHRGTFAVPSGASTGSGEACELRDQDGRVGKAIEHVNTLIASALIGKDASDQKLIDRTMIELDGTENKSHLGGNAIIGVSIAAAKAVAIARGQETWQYLKGLADIASSRKVPHLYMNYINGGKHAASPLAFQEHIIVPDTDSVQEAMDIARAVDAKLKALITAQFGAAAGESMGDEGGYILPSGEWEKPFALLWQAVQEAGFEGKVKLASDVAASSFFQEGSYMVDGKKLSSVELEEMFRSLAKKYPILSIEDPFEENALKDFARLQKIYEPRIVGDDLTVTSAREIEAAANAGAIRAVIIKPNQIGTLTETLEAMSMARVHHIDCIVSHRSGETTDDFVADLAFAFGAFGLKAGSLRKSERIAKYERLRIISV